MTYIFLSDEWHIKESDRKSKNGRLGYVLMCTGATVINALTEVENLPEGAIVCTKCLNPLSAEIKSRLNK